MLKTASGEAPQPKTQILKEIKESSNSFVDKVFRGLDLVKKIQEYIKQADLTWSVEGFALFTLVGIVIGALLGTRLKMLPIRLFRSGRRAASFLDSVRSCMSCRARAKRLGALEAQLPDALDFLSRSMRAGHAFAISLQMVGEELPDPMGREFRTLFNEHNLGAPLEVAHAQHVRPHSAARPALLLIGRHAAETDRRQPVGHSDAALLRDSRAIPAPRTGEGTSAHGRMTAMILGGMPIVTVIALMFVAPGYLDGMAADPDGRKADRRRHRRTDHRQHGYPENHQHPGINLWHSSSAYRCFWLS